MLKTNSICNDYFRSPFRACVGNLKLQVLFVLLKELLTVQTLIACPILQIFVKKVINNYNFDKSKHLELSDSIFGLSQIFLDTIYILEALGQAKRLSTF